MHEHYLESCAKAQHARMQFPIHGASNMVSKTYVPLSVCPQRRAPKHSTCEATFHTWNAQLHAFVDIIGDDFCHCSCQPCFIFCSRIHVDRIDAVVYRESGEEHTSDILEKNQRSNWKVKLKVKTKSNCSTNFVRMRRLCLVSLQRKWRVTFALEGASQSKPIPFQDDQGYSPPDCWAAKFADYVPNSAMLGVSKCNISGNTKMNQTASHINRTYFDVFARSLQRGFILDKGMFFRMIA